MRLPFTPDEFFDVFRRYNEATWPAPILLPLVGVVCIGLLLSHRKVARRAVVAVLGGLWAWMGIAYYLSFFLPLNPAALLFAALSLAQAAMLFFASVDALDVDTPLRDLDRFVGGVMMGVALVLYPALSYLVGHQYPAAPTFGLPCPTTIFTLGVLAWLHEELSWRYAIIPLVWTAISVTAALRWGMVEDLLLPLAAIVLLVLMASHQSGRRRLAKRAAMSGKGA